MLIETTLRNVKFLNSPSTTTEADLPGRILL